MVSGFSSNFRWSFESAESFDNLFVTIHSTMNSLFKFSPNISIHNRRNSTAELGGENATVNVNTAPITAILFDYSQSIDRKLYDKASMSLNSSEI